jgi:hypothetical protein
VADEGVEIVFVSSERSVEDMISYMKECYSLDSDLSTSQEYLTLSLFKAVLGIRIRTFLGLPDTDQLVRVIDLAPDPSLFS